MRSFAEPRSILITGASSGIGAALALSFAAPGVRIALNGRNQQRLDDIAERCRARGAQVESRILDVTDRRGMAGWVAELDAALPLDLIVANAGLSGGTGGGGESEEQTRRIFAVNVEGVLNTVLPAIPLMRARGHGQIAVMSSLAGFAGMPGAPAYGASKAAVRSWGEGMRGALAADGIGVSVICPGFVRSRMTDANDFPMPLLMEAERAAAIIRRGLARNKARIVFPMRLYLAVWLLNALPPAMTEPLLRRLPRKPAAEARY